MSENELPTTPGSVVKSDSLLMLSRFGNWVSDGVFAITAMELAQENFTVLFDAGATPAPVSGDDREAEHLASLGAWANPGHPIADWHSKSEAYAEGFRRGHAAGFSRSPAVQVDAAPLPEGIAEVLNDYRHRVQAAFEWPNPEVAMDVLGQLEFQTLADRVPVAAALRSPVGDGQ